MSKFIVIHGDKNMDPILDVTLPVTCKYAKKFNYDVIVDRETKGKFGPFYEKPRAIYDALCRYPDGTFGAFLDADAMPMDFSVNWINALDEFGVVHLLIRHIEPQVVNAGTMFFVNSPETRRFFRSVADIGPISSELWNYTLKNKYGIDKFVGCNWDERTMLYIMPDFPKLKVEDLDERYNAFHPTQTEYIFHAGLRSIPDKVTLLQMAAKMIRGV